MLTDATVAVNDAADAPDAIDTVAGTVTALLLLAMATLIPPDGAAALTDTEHAVDPAPVNVLVLQESPLTVDVTEVPVPLRLTTGVDAALEIANCPVTGFVVVGLNRTVSAMDCPALSVRGKLPPETVKPIPEIESELMVTGSEPLEVTVIDFDTDAPTATFPNASEVVLRVNAELAALS